MARGKWPDAAAAAEFSFFENQGERCFDLQNQREELVLREDGDGVVHVVGLTSELPTSFCHAPDGAVLSTAAAHALDVFVGLIGALRSSRCQGAVGG